MKTATFVKVLGTLILLAVAAIPAAADEFSFDFQSPVASVTGLIFTSDAPNVFGNFDVTAITGTITGTFDGSGPIGPLLANPNQPNVFIAPNGNFWDNNLIPAAPFVTPNGIGFSFAGDQLVLFSGVTGDPLSEGLFSQNLQESAVGTLSVAQAPEPATWTLLLYGLLLLGLGAARFGFRKQIART
jgi:hypothetical protein